MWVQLSVYAGLFAYNVYQQQKQKKENEERQPSPRWRGPRSGEGAPIPLAYGKVRIDDPLIFISDPTAGAVYDSNGARAGWSYGGQFGFLLCTPAGTNDTTTLHKIWVDNRQVFSGTINLNEAGLNDGNYISTYDSLIFDRDFFGGHANGGRLQMFTVFRMGGASQDENFQFRSVFGNPAVPDETLLSAYRGMCYVGIYADWGESGSIPPLSFEIANYPSELNTTYAKIGDDANPINILYDILTNDWNRAGLPTSQVDTTSFDAASATVHSEGNGMSIVLDRSMTVQDAVQMIQEQVDATVYWDSTDNKYKIKLIREDYVLANLPHFTTANIDTTAPPQPNLVGWANRVNQVRVTYNSRAKNYRPKVSTLINQSGINRVNRHEPVNLEFPGVTDDALAARLTAREMKSASVPIIRMQMVANRDANELRPGDAIKVTWDEYNFSETVFRVQRIGLGTLADSKIKLDLIQDVFAIGDNIWQAPPSQGPLIPTPGVITNFAAIECPRWLVKAYGGNSNFNSRFVYFADKPSTGVNENISANVRNTGEASFDLDRDGLEFSPSFTMKTVLSFGDSEFDAVGFDIENLSNADDFDNIPTYTENAQRLFGAGLAVIYNETTGDHEFIQFGAITGSGSFRTLANVYRGQLDTVPQDWSIGDRGYIFLGDSTADAFRKVGLFTTSDVEAEVKLLSKNAWGTLDIDSVVKQSVPLVARALAPMPVDNLEVSDDGGTTYFKNQQLKVCGQNVVPIKYKRRRYDNNSIYRSTDADDKETDTGLSTVYDIDGRITGDGSYVDNTWTEMLGNDSGDDGPTGQSLVLTPAIGHGDAEIRVTSQHSFGFFGLDSIQSPFVRFHAHRMRQLLSDPSFELASAGTFTYWTVNSGTPGQGDGDFGDGGNAIGGQSGSVASSQDWQIQQTVDMTPWGDLEGITAIITWKTKSASDDNDTAKVTIEALNSGGSPIGSVNSGDLARASVHWDRRKLLYQGLPAGTRQLRVTVDSNAVGGGDTAAHMLIDDMDLRVCQWDSGDDIILNGEFTGTTNWTTSAGSWASGAPGLTNNDTMAALSVPATAYQEVVLTDGYRTESTVLLTGWFFKVSGSGTAEVKIQIMTSGGSVLETQTTGPITPTSTWQQFCLLIDTGSSVNKVRVTIDSTGLGVGFDDFRMYCGKEMHPNSQYNLIEWDNVPTQAFPDTAAEWGQYNSATCPEPDAIWDMGDSAFPLSSSVNGGAAGDQLVSFGSGLTNAAPCAGLREATGTAYNSKTGLEITRGSSRGAQFPRLTDLSIDGTNSWAILCAYRLHGINGEDIGIAGSYDTATSRGWRVRYKGSVNGELELTAQGSSTVTKTTTDSDYGNGSWRYFVVKYNATLGQVHLWTDLQDTTATSEPTGDASNLEKARLGGYDAEDSPDMQIAYSVRWSGSEAEDLVKADTDDWWDHAGDITGQLSTFDINGQLAGTVAMDSLGEIVGGYSGGQVTVLYDASVINDRGLYVGKSWTNQVDPDPNNAGWVAVGTPTLTTRYAQDASRMKRSVRIQGDDTDFLTFTMASVTSGTKAFSFYARSDSGNTNFDVRITDSSDVVINTVTTECDGDWQRIDVILDGSGHTGGNTMKVGISASTSVASQEIEVSWPIGFFDGPAAPLAIPNTQIRGQSPTTADLDQSLHANFNTDGGFDLHLKMSESAPGLTQLLDFGVAATDKRTVILDASSDVTFTHFDGSSSALFATATTAFGWDSERLIRCRWNRAGIRTDNISSITYAEVQSPDGTRAVVRSAIWNAGASGLNDIQLSGPVNPIDGIVSRILIGSREPV